MKPLLFGILIALLTACGSMQAEGADRPVNQTDHNASYPDLGPAPELRNDTWLNVDAPLRLSGLRGRVVAIDMWTFG